MAETKSYYPKVVLKNTEHPSKLLAFPLIGFLIRAILVIPVGILILIYAIWSFLLWLIVPFYIIFTGKYPDFAYTFFLGFARLYAKTIVYMSGLTDKYPGFGLDENGILELDFEKPKNPSKLMGAPLLGAIIRAILLIPFAIFEGVMECGTQWAVIFSWFGVLFKGKYPVSLYEFVHDYIRVTNASGLYLTYLSDTYPSFKISMNHKPIKIILLVLGSLTFLNNLMNNPDTQQTTDPINNNTYENRMYDGPSW